MAADTGAGGETRTIKGSEFEAKCLRLIDDVSTSGAEIVITRNGRPVARLVSYRKWLQDRRGADSGGIEILGDIISPIDVEWEAEVNPDRVLNPRSS